MYLADGRSMIALNWIQHFVRQGHEVHLASLFPPRPEIQLASFHYFPVALSGATVEGAGTQAVTPGLRTRLLHRLAPPKVRTALRHWLVPRTIPRAAAAVSRLVSEIKPDLVHAMRIPYEGMVAAVADLPAPLVVSIWGNDFTLHGPSTSAMRRYTRLALQEADALHADCHRDLRLAREWGFPGDRPAIVLPGGGGVQREIFFPPKETNEAHSPDGLTVINPRGLRAYVNNEAFFQAIPLVLNHHPKTQFLCPTMAGAAQPEKWVAALGIGHAGTLLPRQTRPAMGALFRKSQVIVSPSTHDGTPNTLLEALACGCFPVAGDLESIREWITDGDNGLLVDPNSPQALADAIIAALEDAPLREQARGRNLAIIAARAEHQAVMTRAEIFYNELIG